MLSFMFRKTLPLPPKAAITAPWRPRSRQTGAAGVLRPVTAAESHPKAPPRVRFYSFRISDQGEN